MIGRMSAMVALAAAAVMTAPTASGQQACGTQLLSAFGGSTQHVEVVADLAYVANGRGGLLILDLSLDPFSPQMLRLVDTPDYANDVAIGDGVALVADESGGLQIIDIGDPQRASVISTLATDGVAEVECETGFAYAARDRSLLAIEFADPLSPTVVDSIQMPEEITGLDVVGGFAYVSVGASGVRIVAIDEPSDMKIVGSLDTVLAQGVALENNVLFVADREGGLRSIDVSDPTAPALLDHVSAPGWVVDVAVEGDRATIVTIDPHEQNRVLRVFDISNPAEMSPISTTLFPDGGSGVTVDGDALFVSAGFNGMKIFAIDAKSNVTTSGSFSTPIFAFSVDVEADVAFVASLHLGPHIIDLSDPENPRPLAIAQTPNHVADVVVRDGTAYVAHYEGVQILDVSNPKSPTELAFMKAPGLGLWERELLLAGEALYVRRVGHGSVYAVDLSLPPSDAAEAVLLPLEADAAVLQGTRLLALEESFSTSTLRVFDVEDPLVPSLLGLLDIPGRATGIVVVGDTALVTIHNQGLRAVDLGDPTNPTLLGEIETTATNLFSIEGSLAVGADGSGSIHIFDVSAPSSPRLLNHIERVGVPNDLRLADGLLLVADDHAGLLAFDVSSPAPPRIIGDLDTNDLVNDVSVRSDLAFVAGGLRGLQVIDVADPTAPSLLRNVPTNDQAVAIDLFGSHAAVAVRVAGLRVVDISDPASAVVVGGVDTPGFAFDVQTVGPLAYVADFFGGLQIIDLSDPTSPSIVGSVATPDIAQGVSVEAGRAYIADSLSGVQIVDVSDPTAPTIIGSVDTPGGAAGVDVRDGVAFVADTTSGFRTYDLSDPANPAPLDLVVTPDDATDVTLDRDIAYVAIDEAGVMLVDVSDPSNLRVLATTDTPGAASGAAIDASLAFVADGEAGLTIIDVRPCRSVACAADLTDDARVGPPDLARLLGAWGRSDPSLDFDLSGAVGSGDLAILLDAWGPCP